LSGKFEIEMQAARDLTSFVEGNHLMFLPNIQGPTPHTTTVSLIESDAFSMTLAARNGQAPFPSLPASRLPKDLQIRKSALSAWSVDTTDEAVTVKITPQQPEVRAGVLAELSVATNNIHVSEVISYEVLHRDLSEIRLKTDGVTPTVRLDGTGDALVGTASNSGVVTYALPESLRGTFRVLVDFYWSPRLTSDTNLGSTIALPIVLPNAPDQLNDITIATNAPRSLSIERNEAWTRIHSDEFAAAWLTKTQQTSIPITLQHSLKSRVENKPNFLVLKSVTHGTKLVTSMTAVFGEPADAVLFSISNACTVNEGYMGAQRVSVEPVVKGKDRTTIQLRQPDMSTGTSPITATLIVEQTFTLQNSLFSACKPEVPRILGQDEHCNAIWIIAENPDNSLLHTGDSMVEITSSTALKMTRDKSNTPISGAAALVAPYDRKTREAVLELLDETLQSTNQYSLLAGTVQGKNRLMISVPRRSVLLVTAILGILIYFAILRFRAVSILTTLAILTAAVTVIIAVAPNPGSVILQRLTPGCVLALIAASLQRFFTPAHAATPMALNTTDHSTIFTVDQPINTSLPTDSQLAPTAMMTPP
jgi:hypothetical protein